MEVPDHPDELRELEVEEVLLKGELVDPRSLEREVRFGRHPGDLMNISNKLLSIPTRTRLKTSRQVLAQALPDHELLDVLPHLLLLPPCIAQRK
jgi:hypothetical protein